MNPEYKNQNSLDPARGFGNAILLSIPLWVVFGAIIYGIVKVIFHI